ncbi:MAG: hypothetical protein KGJ23_16255 [Euryarchaeota archaeon]|nr:hypothetical protein [Euryarchaeota archaeon]MDE1838152.1 hypothetical protein [Euryarchaeota archaeon]MDE1879021.1 hypothetical protein [Euryarchaeota archaeon]MDE2046629.1 hypothetical protein [Thermoplasmata archaeon]
MRTELDTIRDLYRHKAEARRLYLRKIWALPVKERYTDRGATFPTLVDIYLHILDDHRFWFIQGYRRQRFDDYPLGVRMSRSEAERATRDVERLTQEVLEELRPLDLSRKILPLGDKNPISIRGMLFQLNMGELQHQGELNALFWQMDQAAPFLGYRLWRFPRPRLR